MSQKTTAKMNTYNLLSESDLNELQELRAFGAQLDLAPQAEVVALPEALSTQEAA